MENSCKIKYINKGNVLNICFYNEKKKMILNFTCQV